MRNEQTLRDDIAFLRALAEGSGSGASREGAVLLAVGVIFGLVALEYWLAETGAVAALRSFRTWLWLDGLVPFLLVNLLISRRWREQTSGPASRALSAAWAGVGVAHVVAALALALAGRRLGLPLLAAWAFPVVLFTLIGATWGVAFAVRRRGLWGVVAAGSFAAAILCGAVMGRPVEWLVLAAGLLVLVGFPGAVILKSGRRPSGS